MSGRRAFILMALLTSGCSSTVTDGSEGNPRGIVGAGATSGTAGSGGGGGSSDECDFSGFTVTSEEAVIEAEAGNSDATYVYRARGQRADDGMDAFMTIFLPTGDERDWSMPQTIGFPGQRLGKDHLAFCPCVVLGLVNSEDSSPFRVFVAFAGSIDITASGFGGDRFVGAMLTKPMKFGKGVFSPKERHFGHEPDGDVWCLDDYQFDVLLEAESQ